MVMDEENQIIKPLPDMEVICRVCGDPFTTEAAQIMGKVLTATVCDWCASGTKTVYDANEDSTRLTTMERRKRNWVRMVGTRYATFEPARLPTSTRIVMDRVMAWTQQPKGIGLSGPPRTGKSPLIYGLGQKLFMAGHDVFPTSGIEFQREYLRGIENKEEWAKYLEDCEECDVLLIDDADKLNLSAGVEAEYYGMLETRRNWERPVLCTLNLSGAQIAALGRDREDRAKAIVERLRDLCEIIAV